MVESTSKRGEYSAVKKTAMEEDVQQRILKANDRLFNSQFRYKNNYIRTWKYNIFTFLPVNLFEQFRRIANFYFMVLLILQLIPQISSLSPVTTALPLIFVLAVSAVKDAVDDIQRHISDKQVNGRRSDILLDGDLTTTEWQNVQVGDIIKMKNNDFVAADILLLSSSEPHSLVYIETAELDGETNLKVRQALPETAKLGEDQEKLGQFNVEINCELPNNKLDRFEGKMTWEGEDYSLSNEQILLRGCRLRNSQWCYGIVIFAGKDTKLMQNSGKTTFKRTSIDRMMNKLVICIFGFLIVACLICTIACLIWEINYGNNFQGYLPWTIPSPVVIALLIFFSYVIILNTVVPISLYVTVEVIRSFQSFWINWDSKMYYEENNTAAKARSTSLSEELGQIQYVFSDKTGTLTQNKMAFSKASIAGRKFGELKDEHGDIIERNDEFPCVDFSENRWYEEKFKFYDPELLQAVKGGDLQTWLFFRVLCLCHTVMCETNDDGSIEYQAQSPDEAALVSAARNFGFVFKGRTPTTISLEVDGIEDQYDLLHILDFNNVRKRMSVVVQQGSKIKLFCKGADNVIFERLSKDCDTLKEQTTQHLHDFAGEGLRTLCLAMKEIDQDFYNQWRKKFHTASISVENREEKMDEVYEEIETEMTLIGATAIEDKLQDGVPMTIENLHKANIKLWVLTGDKQETAINIGYSCNLLNEEMKEMFIVDQTDEEGAKAAIRNALNKIRDVIGMAQKEDEELLDDNVSIKSTQMDDLGDTANFAMVLSGAALAHILESEASDEFVEAACYCKTVICCRVTPLQKAQVVNLVKNSRSAVTLAIGDGANDVSMIKAAHIGIGISGQEGLQAVLASDYSFAQFRFLERLLLVHGRWSYFRTCKFLSYFFYKNFAFTLVHFWFAFFCGFSAMTVYDEYFITLYNICFTSMPVIALGIFDQDVSDEMSIRYPELYKPGQKSKFFNYYVFTKSLLQGVLTSLVIFFIPYGAFYEENFPNGIPSDTQFLFGCTTSAILVIVVNLKIALDTEYWNIFTHAVIWGSIIIYWAFIFLLYSPFLYELFQGTFTYVGVPYQLVRLPSFWFSLILSCVILILPILGKRAMHMDVSPSRAHEIRLKQRQEREKPSNTIELTDVRGLGSMRSFRTKSGKRRPASARSGYAFSHQYGFGDMILSGKNMKKRKKRSEDKVKNGDRVQEG
ncbi:phospholipid-transporting ATPase ID-like isoform X2 [Apostichopus japonicus]|uniref:phospholipid-transporting ATPase ID-like isoform X2 n=1 Tax=Stichopus japonicus TaxID=307972 RepID=UPI003AB3240F